MKIISKWKDYYDYLVHHYGFDETIVYDRRQVDGTTPWNSKNDGQFTIHFCGRKYYVVRDKGRVIWDKDKANKKGWNSDHLFLSQEQGVETNLNVELREPVICEDRWASRWIPNLMEFNFDLMVSPNRAFEDIYAFLSWLKDNPEAPQITDNNCKIKAAGFDTKKSFRPKMK